MKAWFLIVAVLVSFPATAKFYKYRELQNLEQDDLMKVVNAHIRKARQLANQNEAGDDDKDTEAIEELREAMRYGLSRPNRSDKLLDTMFIPVRRELLDFHAYEDTLIGLVNEAMAGLNDKKVPVAYRATFVFVLENSLSEMKPEYGARPEFKRELEKVRDAKIELDEDVKRELLMTSMYQLPSPSETAKKILAQPPRMDKPQVDSSVSEQPTPVPTSSGKPKHKIDIH